MEGVTEGRMVHFVLDRDRHRPAIIVNAWNGVLDEGKVNLQIFLDGENDREFAGNEYTTVYAGKHSEVFSDNTRIPMIMWRTSAKYSEDKEQGTWHWPERN